MITFPYISRVLEPDGVGKVNLALSIVGYFVMISQVGIPVYGIKEIAKVRDNKEKLGKIFSELFIINLIMMAISLSIYLTLFLFVEKIQNDKILFMVVGINIILNLFSIDWFYSGIEEYKYITIRSLVVRVLSIFLLFIFVKEKQDYIYYAALSVLSIGGANLANIIGLKKGKIICEGRPLDVINKENLNTIYGIDANLTTSEDGKYPICMEYDLFRGINEK